MVAAIAVSVPRRSRGAAAPPSRWVALPIGVAIGFYDGFFGPGTGSLLIVGFVLSLVLAETAPDRATQLARRGREFAQSRVACGVHWQSDVDAGRDVGAAVVAQLHGNEEFLTQLAQARKEVATARAAGARPTADCAAEAAALDAK